MQVFVYRLNRSNGSSSADLGFMGGATSTDEVEPTYGAARYVDRVPEKDILVFLLNH